MGTRCHVRSGSFHRSLGPTCWCDRASCGHWRGAGSTGSRRSSAGPGWGRRRCWLERHLAAADLYRGDLHADLPDAGWFTVAREHYRSRFVRAAVRAGQLLLGRRDDEHAEALARRALALDPWNEDAYAILVVAALARGDRSAARQWLARCLEAVADLGLEPSDTTLQLRRRLHGHA